jgi:anhydro-N-acetylmuramic acid kinase
MAKEGKMRALGLMSGTSMDGIDAALIETDGENAVAVGPHAAFPFSSDDRNLLRQAVADAAGLSSRQDRPGCLAAAETLITLRHAEAVEAFCAREGIAPESIDLIGFHGQTVLHRPAAGLTVQLGDGAALANRLGVPVTWDFRAADVAAGGQGAPLVPIYHRALADSAGLAKPLVLINLGGVANLTFLPEEGDPLACDTGPGNALLDDLMLERTGQPCDRDGAMAAAGRADAAALANLLDHPYFRVAPPKSLDRNTFSRQAIHHLTTADAAATLAAFTAAAVAQAVALLPARPRQAIICGGGGHNPSIMGELRARLGCPVLPAQDFGWALEAIEAQAFAYLAVRTLKHLPISFPSTTGVPVPMPGGIISYPGAP